MDRIDYKDISYKIIGTGIEVHNLLGKEHKEIVYGDALELEFSLRKVSFIREVIFEISYKDNVLNHHYFADFVVYDKIILEINAIELLFKSHVKQTLNYLAALKLGLLANFVANSLEYKRVVL